MLVMNKLSLVSCGRIKEAEPMEARQLYAASHLFKATRDYVEAVGYPWLILSGKHFLLRPETVIEPYDEPTANLHRMPRAYRFWWSTLTYNVLVPYITINNITHIDIYAGLRYRSFLVDWLIRDRMCIVDVPFEFSGGVGETTSALKYMLENLKEEDKNV